MRDGRSSPCRAICIACRWSSAKRAGSNSPSGESTASAPTGRSGSPSIWGGARHESASAGVDARRMVRRTIRTDGARQLRFRSGDQELQSRHEGRRACTSCRDRAHRDRDGRSEAQRLSARTGRHHRDSSRRSCGIRSVDRRHDRGGESSQRSRRQVLRMTTKPTAILFDLDGVLIDATEWHYESLNRALALFGFSINRYEHLSAYNGLPTRTKLEMLSVEKGLPRALHPLIKRLKQVYTKAEILSKCWPVVEKEHLLSRLRREGYTLAVCSNAIRETMTLMLERSGVLKYFELVLSNEDVDRPKPDPEI